MHQTSEEGGGEHRLDERPRLPEATPHGEFTLSDYQLSLRQRGDVHKPDVT